MFEFLGHYFGPRNSAGVASIRLDRGSLTRQVSRGGWNAAALDALLVASDGVVFAAASRTSELRSGERICVHLSIFFGKSAFR